MNAPLHTFNQFLDPFAHAPGRTSAVLGAPSLSHILEQAKEMRPYLIANAQLTEQNRRVSEETTQ